MVVVFVAFISEFTEDTFYPLATIVAVGWTSQTKKVENKPEPNLSRLKQEEAMSDFQIPYLFLSPALWV